MALNSHIAALIPNVMVFEGGTFDKSSLFDEIMIVELSWWDKYFLKRDRRYLSEFTHQGKAM